MPFLSTKTVVTTGAFILAPASILYTFHSQIGTPDPIRNPVTKVPEYLFDGGLQKRADSFDPGTYEEFAKQDVWRGVQMSRRCSRLQRTRAQKGWIESGYLASVFRLGLEELKYERAVGDYLGHAWKTNNHTQTISDNFAQIEMLHSGGVNFTEKLEIYCDETRTPPETLKQCENNNCCESEEGKIAGGYSYIRQGLKTPPRYTIVLCPSYFNEKTVQEKARALKENSPGLEGIEEVKKNVWALYPNLGTMFLHLQFHLPFVSGPLSIGDAAGHYKPATSAQLAFKDPDQVTRTAENYAVAALAAAQILIFGLEIAPISDEKQDINGVKLPDILKTVFKDLDENMQKATQTVLVDGNLDVSRHQGAKPGAQFTSKPELSPVLDGDLSSISDSWANYTLPPPPSRKPFPKDFSRKVYKGMPAVHRFAGAI
ncbi:hypothetical protein TWF730_005871 [Orbilia blumenaviensis]|uniref:Uncharacterized protein n=1 Tax=Orbilia blumenaviensis TaxID=1796055 RepID=A0AAV9VJN1_9PEZI